MGTMLCEHGAGLHLSSKLKYTNINSDLNVYK